MRRQFDLPLASFVSDVPSDPPPRASSWCEPIRRYDAAARWIQKYYERTNQVIENKGEQFYGPTKLLKTVYLPSETNQLIEGIIVSITTKQKIAVEVSGKRPERTEKSQKECKIQNPYERTRQLAENKRRRILKSCEFRQPIENRPYNRQYPVKYLKACGLIGSASFLQKTPIDTKPPGGRRGARIQKPYERTQYVVENKCDDISAPSILLKM